MADKQPKALDDPEGFIMDYPPYGNRVRGEAPPRGLDRMKEAPPRGLDRMKEAPPKALDDPEGFIRDYPPYGNRARGEAPPQRFNQGGKIKGNGGHTVHNYCAGGKVISSKNM